MGILVNAGYLHLVADANPSYCEEITDYFTVKIMQIQSKMLVLKAAEGILEGTNAKFSGSLK